MDKKRIDYLFTKHEEEFGCRPDFVFSTSGRTELGGNHTDHNLGCVIAGSINLDIMAVVKARNDNQVSIISEGYLPILIDLSDLRVRDDEKNTTQAIVRGVAASFVKRNGNFGGFTAYSNSSVPVGSGLSSSAAFEVMIGTIFNHLYNNENFSTTDLAIIGQEAENKYFGKPSGLMDQVACANGGVVGIDFFNPEEPVITPLQISFEDYGYNLIIVNTGGSHADLTSDYSSIPSEMKAVAGFFNKDALRFVDFKTFSENISELRLSLSNDRAVLRAYHFLQENSRAQQMVQALTDRDFDKYLSLVTESGNSSFKYLQNIYSPHASENQGISIALAMSENFLRDKGACRVQGGGFAGTIQAYVPMEKTESYFSLMEGIFGPDCCVKVAIRNKPTCCLNS